MSFSLYALHWQIIQYIFVNLASVKAAWNYLNLKRRHWILTNYKIDEGPKWKAGIVHFLYAIEKIEKAKFKDSLFLSWIGYFSISGPSLFFPSYLIFVLIILISPRGWWQIWIRIVKSQTVGLICLSFHTYTERRANLLSSLSIPDIFFSSCANGN